MKLLLNCLILAIFVTYISALTIKVHPHQEECFYEPIKKANVKVKVQFEVSQGGMLDIDAKIQGPSGQIIHQVQKQSDAIFTFNANEIGHYKVCFSNVMNTVSPKSVSFYIHVGELVDPNLAKLAHLDPIEHQMLKLSEGLAIIENEQKHLRASERHHRDLTEATNSRLFWWSSFQFIVVLSITVFQIYYLQSIFKVQSPV
mmetsp:Transcript_1059/g.1648  ORF Transcript_1059/g.1648 Transcript_1059/m.1648 type:complete len:201 (-) Transcript_1059:90-692(-)